ncbi:MAG TPA: glycoside hydrolase family 5 protein [Pirellulales bacterium]|nr:glycoside hydrolase family 5 protein [Pirellulales bacterium]
MSCNAKSKYFLTATLIVLAGVTRPAEFCRAADKPVKPKSFVDFGDAASFHLRGAQAQGTLIKGDGGTALDIRTDADAAYPGVFIDPQQGKWDLAEFDAVEMDVRNPQQVSVRVLLSINNPGANGREHCNVESVTVPAGGKATLIVPFGMWHGDPDHPIDRANVVSLQVLLDRPGRAHHFQVDAIRATSLDAAGAATFLNDPFFQRLTPVFGRGMNLGNALEAPREGEWEVTLKEGYFERIKSAGFDTVRIPVRWSAHAGHDAPYTIEPAFFARVDWAIEQALRRDLRAIVNVHHYDEIMKDPDAHRARFLGLWRQIAEHYRDRPAELAFELLNEPIEQLTAERWNKLLAEALAVIRRSNPRREIVVGPVGANSIRELDGLQLPEDDRHLIVTVHYYSPFQFTHQGASWTGPQAEAWLGRKWTGTPAEKNAIRRDLNQAIDWGIAHRRPIFVGEFGAYGKADLASRALWTQFMVQEVANRKMGWAYWEFCSGFGAYDPQREAWIEPIEQALAGKQKELNR